MLVTLPWVRDPVQPLIDKHRGKSNIHQALRVYKSQCTKGPEIKKKVRIAHSKLVERDFMTKLSDLPPHMQEFIRTADFNHYYCWRVVYKEDSQSTPVRLVVDPSMSGLNFLCPKLFLLCLINLLIFLGFPGSIMFISEILFFTFLFDLFPLLYCFLVVLLYLIAPTFVLRT